MNSKVKSHNRAVRAVWRAFHAGAPTRVPVVFNFNTRYFLLDRTINRQGITFREYFDNPQLMLRFQLESQRWRRLHVPQDLEMGPPAVAWDPIAVDFQNVYEAAWFGCPIIFLDDQVPDTLPILRKDKRLLDEMEIPDPLHDGLMARAFEFYHMFLEQLGNLEFKGRPVAGVVPLIGSDGIFTTAINLRGASEFCLDLHDDPDFAHRLLDFATTGIIRRLRAWMQVAGLPDPLPGWGFGDDSIQLLSPATYRAFVLPYHRRLLKAVADPPYFIHLCGDVGHLLPILKAELGIVGFDTGYPLDLGAARRALGPEVLLRGNIHPDLLRRGPPGHIRAAVREVLASGVMEGGRFILCEGHNVAPGTPVEHLQAMYQAGLEFGRYPSGFQADPTWPPVLIPGHHVPAQKTDR